MNLIMTSDLEAKMKLKTWLMYKALARKNYPLALELFEQLRQMLEAEEQDQHQQILDAEREHGDAVALPDVDDIEPDPGDMDGDHQSALESVYGPND